MRSLTKINGDQLCTIHVSILPPCFLCSYSLMLIECYNNIMYTINHNGSKNTTRISFQLKKGGGGNIIFPSDDDALKCESITTY